MINMIILVLLVVAQDPFTETPVGEVYSRSIKSLIEEIRERRRERREDSFIDEEKEDRKRESVIDAIRDRWSDRKRFFDGSLIAGVKWIILIGFGIITVLVLLKVKELLSWISTR